MTYQSVKNRILTKPGYRVLACVAIIIAGMNLDYHSQKQESAVRASEKPEPIRVVESHQEKALAAYFERRGEIKGNDAKRMAHACSQTSAPRLSAAIARIESRGKVMAKHPESGAKGAYQVKERHWGKVPAYKGAEVLQALQSEKILEDLLAENGDNLKKALNRYGGSTDGRYARMVLAELTEVPK